MSGIINSLEDTIEGLRQTIGDRYKTGYAVVKELIQNADDAEAQRLDLACVSGFAAAVHPLLRGPCVVVLNNGAFSPTNAISIHRFTSSDKSADVSRIGRFGLGLKSVYHLCEAFFYLSSHGVGWPVP